MVLLNKTLIHVEPFVPLVPIEVYYMEKNLVFLLSFRRRKKEMNILIDMGVIKLSGHFYSGSELMLEEGSVCAL